MVNLMFAIRHSRQIVERAIVDPRRCYSTLLFAFAWNPCSFCRGIGVRFAVEFMFAYAWNPCSLCRGIFSYRAGEVILRPVTSIHAVSQS
ncbi:hypothetical protein [Paraburkholderia hospita]|uniref:hypothetical protein n=1 Tax=Paraburkholderia hospita TaxID=169430 RepID=UPI001319CA41|nr:hypothetical protein [Paraburkholderia hospita]